MGLRPRSANSSEWSINFSAVVFNTGFAFLAIATLCGIVFITRPKQVMHDIPLAVVRCTRLTSQSSPFAEHSLSSTSLVLQDPVSFAVVDETGDRWRRRGRFPALW